MPHQQHEPTKRFKIRPKVLWGFSLLLVLVFATLMVTYWGVEQLAETRKSLTGPSQKLVILNSTLTLIYQSESSIRAYSLNQDEKLLKQYVRSLRAVRSNIDSLSLLVASDSLQSVRVQRVKQLLRRKGLVLEELISLKQTDWSNEFYVLAMEEIARLEKDSTLRDAVIVKTTTTTTSKRDTLVKRPPKEPPGFFSRLRGWFTGDASSDTTITLLRVEEHISIDTLRRSWVPTDSLLRDVLGILNQIRIRQDETLTKLSAKELELLQTDLRLIDQIRAIVSLLEAEELDDNLSRAENAKEVVGKSTILIMALSGLAILISTLFIILILRTVRRSDFYRNQLIDANLYADKLLYAKEEFLANMSHEIRSPLTAIIGFARLLEQTPLDGDQQDYLGSISISSSHLLDIVNDLLDLSKIEGGFLRLEQTPFVPFHIAREVISLLSSKAHEKNLYLSLKGDDELSKLGALGDPYRLKQMLINLVGNAIKFTEEGGVELTIAVEKGDGETIGFVFEVTDTGIGIESEQIGELFERFTQADRGVTRKYGGTGLGLAIVKKLALMQRGTISVASQPGQGSTFTLKITYPIAQCEPPKHESEATTTLPLPDNLKILVVDDDPLIRELLQRMIAHLGPEVSVVGSPTEALKMVQESHFDVVLSDIQMPTMSGFDFVAAFKQMNLDTAPSIIAITANNVGSELEPYMNAGFMGVLTKPFNEFSLRDTIALALGITPAPMGKTEAQPVGDEPPYSLADIEQFCENDTEALRAAITSIVASADLGLAQLELRIQEQNWDEFLSITHRMKSTFGQIRSHGIVDLIHQAERALESGNLQLATDIIKEAKAQFGPIRSQLVQATGQA